VRRLALPAPIVVVALGLLTAWPAIDSQAADAGAATAITVSSSLNPSTSGEAIVLSATVLPTPSGGTVAFADNGVPIAACLAQAVSAGIATCTTSYAALGAENIVATYSGSPGFAPSASPTMTQVVSQSPCALLADCNLMGLNLANANLSGANLSGADLYGADMANADLANATLYAANLINADLSNADLSNANLLNSYLGNANMFGASLTGARFTAHCATISDPGASNARGVTSFLDLSLGDATPNLWNTSSSSGSVLQCYDPAGGLTENVNLSSVQQGGFAGAPYGFTEAGYGYGSYGGRFCSLDQFPCPTAPFPIPVSAFVPGSKYLTTIDYSIVTPTQPMDLTYDLWLEQQLSGLGPQSGDAEIMITPYSTFSACGAPRPSFTDSSGAVWQVYVGCGSAKAQTVHFVLSSPTPVATGSITVNLSDFVAETAALLPSNPIASEQLVGLEVGSEFGRCGTTGCPDAAFSWTISRLTLQTPSTSVAMIP